MSDFQSGGYYIKNQILYDAKGNQISTIKDGNIYFLATRDGEQIELLREMCTSLKKLLSAMEQIVDDEVLERDLEDEDCE